MVAVHHEDPQAPGGGQSAEPGHRARLAGPGRTSSEANKRHQECNQRQRQQQRAAETRHLNLISSCDTYDKQTSAKHNRDLEWRPNVAGGARSSESNRKWWRRTRIHVALLGLAIAVVNCYAQATFCIAIVEMVLPADYEASPSEPNELTTTTTSHLVTASRSVATAMTSDPFKSPEDQSCPIEFKYRNYYDNWRFQEEPSPPQQQHQPKNSTGKQQATGANGDSSTEHHPSHKQQTIDMSNRFDWDASQQGLLLGAFAVGTAPLQIIGGRLAEIYGSKWVLLMGCIGTGLTNLAIPQLARFSFLLLLVDRILMGVAQAGMEPGLMCLLADWLTPQEASFFISMLLFAICLGFFLGSLGSSFILALDYGWPLTYYICAGLNLLVALVWYLYADSWPRASKYISLEELKFIEREQARERRGLTSKRRGQLDTRPIHDLMITDDCQGCARTATKTKELNDQLSEPQQHNNNISPRCSCLQGAININNINNHDETNTCAVQQQGPPPPAKLEDPLRAPWLNILSSPPVWAFIICKISIRWCADVISNELPSYLANVLHLSIKINGLLNSFSSALFAISSFITGWLATSKMCMRCEDEDQDQDDGGDRNENANHHDRQNEEEGEGSHKPTPKLNSDLTNQRQNRHKTRLRKGFQSLASFGSAICLILMTRYDCDILVSMSSLLALSCFVVMGTGGELQIAYDMTSRYPGTLHGMACTLSVSGWLAPPLYGLILGDQPSSRSRWSIVWYSTAAINLFGGLVFVLFADASPRDFDSSSPLPSKLLEQQKHKKASNSKDADHERGKDGDLGAGAAYFNGGLQHGSSCESSPKSNHQKPGQKKQLSLVCSEKLTSPLQAAANSIGFDSGQLVRCHQSESSFMRPASCYAFDSPLQLDSNSLIFPYDKGPGKDGLGPKHQHHHHHRHEGEPLSKRAKRFWLGLFKSRARDMKVTRDATRTTT